MFYCSIYFVIFINNKGFLKQVKAKIRGGQEQNYDCSSVIVKFKARVKKLETIENMLKCVKGGVREST